MNQAGRYGVSPLDVDPATGRIKKSEYELPKASSSTLGGVKVGARLSIASDGKLSADRQVPQTNAGEICQVLTVVEGDIEWRTPAGGGAKYTTLWTRTNESNASGDQNIAIEDMNSYDYYLIKVPMADRNFGYPLYQYITIAVADLATSISGNYVMYHAMFNEGGTNKYYTCQFVIIKQNDGTGVTIKTGYKALTGSTTWGQDNTIPEAIVGIKV